MIFMGKSSAHRTTSQDVLNHNESWAACVHGLPVSNNCEGKFRTKKILNHILCRGYAVIGRKISGASGRPFCRG